MLKTKQSDTIDCK